MTTAPLPRRLGAMLYDCLLVFALMCLGTLPFVAAQDGKLVPAGTPLHQAVLIVIAWFFFAGFWSRHGRTLGMQSWGLRIESSNGQRPSFARATLRFFAAILSLLPAGLGFWWQIVDADNLTWHDRLSGTKLLFHPKPSVRKTGNA